MRRASEPPPCSIFSAATTRRLGNGRGPQATTNTGLARIPSSSAEASSSVPATLTATPTSARPSATTPLPPHFSWHSPDADDRSKRPSYNCARREAPPATTHAPDAETCEQLGRITADQVELGTSAAKAGLEQPWLLVCLAFLDLVRATWACVIRTLPQESGARGDRAQ